MARERMPTLGNVRALAVVVAVVAALGSVYASAAQAVPAKFWGVVPQASPNFERLQRLHRGGVDSLRIPVGWESAQPTRGAPFVWSDVDSRVEETTLAGIEVLPFLSTAPSWAVRQAWVPGSGHRIKAPERLPATGSAAAGWSAFVRAAAERYGPGGSFWLEHPTLPQRPIRTWQIWNEENFKYFVTKPNPAEYGKLVKISSAAIRSVDPGAQIVLGGLFARPGEARFKVKPPQAYFATDFLDRMYKTTPGIKSRFDGIALHPYTSTYRELAPEIEEFREVLTRHHDSGKGLWITELGWSSEPPSLTDSFAKGPKGQVTQLKGAFNVLAHNQLKWRLKRIYWFAIDDYAGVCNFCGGSGLFTADFLPKKSWFAYVKYSGGRP
jgi:polysaccharide biosynthesis protein PslG